MSKLFFPETVDPLEVVEIDAGPRKSKYVPVRFPAELHDDLVAEAEKRKVSVSDVVRDRCRRNVLQQ